MQQLPALWWGERYPDTTYHMLSKTKQMWTSKEGLFDEVILFWLASLFNKGVRNQKSGEKISLTILDSFLSSFARTKWWQLTFFLEIHSHLYVTNASYRHWPRFPDSIVLKDLRRLLRRVRLRRSAKIRVFPRRVLICLLRRTLRSSQRSVLRSS